MPIVIVCGACGHHVTVPDDYQRQQFQCPFCGRLLVGMPPVAVPVPAAPQPVPPVGPAASDPPADGFEFDSTPRRTRRPHSTDDDVDGDTGRDDRRRRKQERQGRGALTAWILVGVGALVIVVLGLVLLLSGAFKSTRPGKRPPLN